MDDKKILMPISISMILIGAVMPYAFSALTMKSVGSAAAEMVLKKTFLYFFLSVFFIIFFIIYFSF